MNWLRAAFSFHGRRSRSQYWTTLFLIWIAVACSGFVFMVPVVGPLVGAPGILASMVAGLANAVRRMHDRGRPGYALMPFYVLIMIGQILTILGRIALGDDALPIGALLSLPASLWLLIELGCLKGTDGPNRFGADPLGPARTDGGPPEDEADEIAEPVPGA